MRRLLSFACFIAVGLTSIGARATEYVDDPLTSSTFTGRGSVGGTFDASGWTVTGDSDTLWYEIPDALVRGSVSFSVTGYSLSSSLVGGDHDVLAIYQAPTGLAEPIDYLPGYRNNDFKVFVRVFGSLEPSRPGATKMESYLCPQGPPWYHDSCPSGCETGGFAYWNGGTDPGWDAATTYRITVVWGDGTMTFSRDDGQTASVSYTGTYSPQPLRVRLGSPRNTGGDQTMPHATYKDLVVSGDVGAPAALCGATTPTDAGSDASTTTDAGSATELAPLQDVTAASWEPAVFSDVTDLNVEASAAGAPTAVVFLKFPALSGKVTHAILRLHSRTDPSSAGGSGAVHAVTDASWSETTMTWTSKPSWGSAVAGSERSIDADQDVEWDVTSVLDPTSPNLAVVSTDGNGAHYFSKEGSTTQGPKLFVTLDTTTPGDAGGDAALDAPKTDASAVDASSDAKVHLDGSSNGSSNGSSDEPSSDAAKGGCSCATTPTDAKSPWFLVLFAIPLLRRRRRCVRRGESAVVL